MGLMQAAVDTYEMLEKKIRREDGRESVYTGTDFPYYYGCSD